ncbi:hypothetical protein AVEN_177028-1 [Araneus ventricosus]|uniref:Uncharacterized protein n=1 Tax=Araneus ventricosus TaxID=182803 RepID=A0A4Y2V1D1_ARAVE|nr:hypothetical protein AVEN_177028-1 [Araneus ventricosus]
MSIDLVRSSTDTPERTTGCFDSSLLLPHYRLLRFLPTSYARLNQTYILLHTSSRKAHHFILRLSLTAIYCGVDYSALCAGYRSNPKVGEDGFHCLIDKLIIYENKDYHMDCAEVLENGNTESRVHTIWSRSRFAECASIDVQLIWSLTEADGL